MSEKAEKIEFDARSLRVRAAESCLDLDSAAPIRMRGTMLWFNAAKDLGALRTDDGERIEVPGTAFASSGRPVGPCAGKAIEFDSRDGMISAIAFVREVSPRRARARRRL